MNWDKVKEKFPNCYLGLKEMHEKTGADKGILLRNFCAAHGETSGISPMPGLKRIEEKLNEASSSK